MILLLILLLLSFIGYHFVYFSYVAYIFHYNKSPIKLGAICAIINALYWWAYIFHFSIEYEMFALLGYAVLLLIETKIFFRVPMVQTAFIATTFSINLFAKRMAVMATMALLGHDMIPAIFSDVEAKIVLCIVTFALSIGTINFSRKMISRIYLDTILADNKNISFITIIYSILFVMLFAFFSTIGVEAGGDSLLHHYILTGTFVILAFAIFIVYAYYLADLRISTEVFMQVSQKNEEEAVMLKELEKEANVDMLTKLYTREFADQTLAEKIRTRQNFFIAFIDLDGLKVVNDYYGHEEGDFYIQSAADMLREVFSQDLVSRYGGDEFVVVGLYQNEEEITHRLVRCYSRIHELAKVYQKPYSTSASYGVAFRNAQESITAKELIAIADARMYEMKQSNNRHRKVVHLKIKKETG